MNVMKHFINGRKKLIRKWLEEGLVGLVEWRMVVPDHSLGTNKPQPDHQRLQVAELEVIQ